MSSQAALFWDEAAEHAALGATLVNTAACDYVCRNLPPADLYRETERRILQGMIALHGEGRGVDVVSLGAQLGADTELVAYLHHLAGSVPVVANVPEYVAMVRDGGRRRRLYVAAQAAQEALAAGNGEGVRAFRETLTEALDREAAQTEASAAAVIDWSAFWAQDHSAEEWVYQDVLARSRGHALYAVHKGGKSLLALYVAARLATGPRPIVVVYLDFEMTEADLFDRLEDMGYGPHSDLSRLSYALLPSFPPLDTPQGGDALMSHLDAVQGRWADHHLVVIVDTISRAICGEENSADTWRDFYTYTGIRLKRRGATWVRLDHAGKDADRGQRGSSAKGDDVDVIWNLKPTENGVMLQRHKARMSWVPEHVTFKMTDDPLAFVPLTGDWPAGTGEVASILDRLDVPLDATTRNAATALRTIDEGRRRSLVVAAQRFRRERLKGEV